MINKFGLCIQRLHDVKVQAFIAEEATDLESYGLQTPAWHVSLNIGQDHTPLTLSLGKVDSERKGVYAKRDDVVRVFLLPQELWDNLPKTATALRDKTLMNTSVSTLRAWRYKYPRAYGHDQHRTTPIHPWNSQ